MFFCPFVSLSLFYGQFVLVYFNRRRTECSYRAVSKLFYIFFIRSYPIQIRLIHGVAWSSNYTVTAAARARPYFISLSMFLPANLPLGVSIDLFTYCQSRPKHHRLDCILSFYLYFSRLTYPGVYLSIYLLTANLDQNTTDSTVFYFSIFVPPS